MKKNLIAILALMLFLTFNHLSSTAFAQGTAFTYQGQLQNNGASVNGTYNLQFSLYTTNTGGSLIAGPVTNSAVAVTNGLFTVTIDFGSSVWNGQTNWLQIGVETNNATSFAMLSPRQPVTPTPYAITAESLDGTVLASQLGSIGNTNGGGGNFFLGSSGNLTTSGSDNTANGFLAFDSNTTGSYNTADGVQALGGNTTGSRNTADGVGALALNTSGSDNIALGYLAGLNITTGSSNIDIGNEGFSSDTNIIRIGNTQAQTFIAGVINGNGGGLTSLNAAQLASVGNNAGGRANFFVGPSGSAATTGSSNTAVGVNALISNTGGAYNTAVGADTLVSNVGGYYSTAVGFGALQNSTGGYNTAIGVGAMESDTSGQYNAATGNGALSFNSYGAENVADGYLALNANTSGDANTGDGYGALVNNTIGFDNVADGERALWLNTNGCYNTGIGGNALFDCTSGSNNVALGFDAGVNITTGTSNIDIGNVGVATDNNLIRIGTTQTATYLVGTVYANSVALTSDRNAKEHFTPINTRTLLDKVAALPITEWNYKSDTQAQHIGPMAQDFKAAFGLDGADDKHISVVDEGGVALAAVQGLNQKLESDNAELKRENNLLTKRLDDLEAEVKTLARSGR